MLEFNMIEIDSYEGSIYHLDRAVESLGQKEPEQVVEYLVDSYESLEHTEIYSNKRVRTHIESAIKNVKDNKIGDAKFHISSAIEMIRNIYRQKIEI